MRCGQCSQEGCFRASSHYFQCDYLFLFLKKGGSLPVDHIELVEMLQRKKQLCAVETRSLLVKPLFTLQVVEELSAIDETAGFVNTGSTQRGQSTYASTRYSFCSDWKLNFRGTINGLLTRAKTNRSASV